MMLEQLPIDDYIVKQNKEIAEFKRHIESQDQLVKTLTDHNTSSEVLMLDMDKQMKDTEKKYSRAINRIRKETDCSNCYLGGTAYLTTECCFGGHECQNRWGMLLSDDTKFNDDGSMK